MGYLANDGLYWVSYYFLDPYLGDCFSHTFPALLAIMKLGCRLSRRDVMLNGQVQRNITIQKETSKKGHIFLTHFPSLTFLPISVKQIHSLIDWM